jgi:autotransporter translocation and assembly factor TamB
MWIRRWRWWRAALLTAVGVLGAVFAVSWVIVRVWGPAFTRDRVEALLSEALGQPVHVGAVHLAPWRLRLSLADLDIPGTAPGAMRLSAAAIDVHVDIASIWRREITLSGRATDLRLDLVLPETSAGGPPLFPLPQHLEAGPLRIGIGSLRVRHADVTVSDPSADLTIETRGADVTGRPVAGDLVVSGQLDTLRVDVGGRGEQVDRVTLAGRLAADRIAIRQVDWLWQGEPMRLDGEVRRPWEDNPELSLRVKGDVALGALATALHLDARLDGNARIAAEIKGPAQTPGIGGQVRIPELRVEGVEVRDVSIDGGWDDRKLRLDTIEARLGTGRLRAGLEIKQGDAGVASVALDLQELVLPGSLTGVGAGTGAVEGSLRDGAFDLRRADVQWPGLEISVDGRIAAGAALALRGKVTADLGEVGRALALGPLSGRASLAAEVRGRGSTMAIEGRADVAGLIAAGHAVEPVEASFRMAASPGPDSRWTGTVDSPRVAWDQVTVDTIRASLILDRKQIELVRGQARVAAVPVEVTGVWSWVGSGRAHATAGPVALGAISGVPPTLRVDGTGRATADASVERGVVSASATVRLDQASAAGISLGDGRTEVQLRGQKVQGELSFPDRRLHASAAGTLDSNGVIAVSAELDDLALPSLLRELGSAAADHVGGRVSGHGELSIPLRQPGNGRGVARLTPHGLRLLGEPWASQGPIVLRLEGPRLTIERMRLDGPAGRFSARGVLAGPDSHDLVLALDGARLPGALGGLGLGTVRSDVRLGDGIEVTKLDARWPSLTAAASGRAGEDGALAFTARVDADLASLGPALGLFPMEGRATFTTEVKGHGEAIEAEGAVRASGVKARGATLSDIELPFRVSRRSLRIDGARARLGASPISVDAGAALTGTGQLTADSLARHTHVTVDVRAPKTRLDDLAPFLPAALRGRGDLALTARAEGTPSAWHGTGTLASRQLDLGIGPLRKLDVSFAADQTRIRVTELRVDVLGIPAHASADWAWAGGGSAKATLGPASLAGLAPAPAGSGLKGTGQASIEATIRSPADISGTIQATVDGLAVGKVVLGRGQVDASAREGDLHAEVAFPEPGIRISATGRIDAGGTLTAEATTPEIDLGPLSRALDIPAGLGGTLSARATARVPLADPQRGEGILSIDPLRLAVASETWKNDAPVQVRWANGQVSLESFRMTAREGEVSGAGTLAADGKLDARVSARVPLAMLAAMRPEVSESGGLLDLSVRASGSLGAPTFTGDGAIHGGSLLLRGRPEILRGLEARVSLSSQGVRLSEATGTIGGGRVRARGDLALRGWQPGGYRVRLQAKNVSVGRIEGFSSAWDADLELSGITREAQLQGRARLVRGLYNRDLSILALATSRSAAPVADTGPGLRLSVRVDLNDNLVVRNSLANLRADGVLTVQGTTAHPVVFGSIESRDGHIAFRGHDWSVASAAVRLADPRRLDPYLDVLATTRIGEYDVSMQITGPVSDVAVRFSSSPRLSQSDLLSLVAFGVTGADLRDSPATVLLGEAGKLLAQNVLGVEPGSTGLRISTGSANSTANELRGFPGEERSPVATSQSAPGGRKETVRVEYQLLTPLFLSGEYDRSGGYGADVILRFRFR